MVRYEQRGPLLRLFVGGQKRKKGEGSNLNSDLFSPLRAVQANVVFLLEWTDETLKVNFRVLIDFQSFPSSSQQVLKLPRYSGIIYMTRDNGNAL